MGSSDEVTHDPLDISSTEGDTIIESEKKNTVKDPSVVKGKRSSKLSLTNQRLKRGGSTTVKLRIVRKTKVRKDILNVDQSRSAYFLKVNGAGLFEKETYNSQYLSQSKYDLLISAFRMLEKYQYLLAEKADIKRIGHSNDEEKKEYESALNRNEVEKDKLVLTNTLQFPPQKTKVHVFFESHKHYLNGYRKKETKKGSRLFRLKTLPKKKYYPTSVLTELEQSSFKGECFSLEESFDAIYELYKKYSKTNSTIDVSKKKQFSTFVAKKIPTVSNEMARMFHEALVFESKVVGVGRENDINVSDGKRFEESLKEGNTHHVDIINPVTKRSPITMCEVTPVEKRLDQKSAKGTLISNKTKSSNLPVDHSPTEGTLILKSSEGPLIRNETQSPITICEVTPAEKTFDETSAEVTLIPNKGKSSSNTLHDDSPVEETLVDISDEGPIVVNDTFSPIIMCEGTPAEKTFDEKSSELAFILNNTKSSTSPCDDSSAEETHSEKSGKETLILNATKSPISMCKVMPPAEKAFVEKVVERPVTMKKTTTSSISGEQHGVEKECTVCTTSQGVVNSAISVEGDLSCDNKNTKDSLVQNSKEVMAGDAGFSHNVDQEPSILHYDRTTVLSAMIFGGVQLYKTTDYKFHYVGLVLSHSRFIEVQEVSSLFNRQHVTDAIFYMLNRCPHPPQHICFQRDGVWMNEYRYDLNTLESLDAYVIEGDNDYMYRPLKFGSKVRVIFDHIYRNN